MPKKIIWTEEPVENPVENPEKLTEIFGDGYTISDYYHDRIDYLVSFDKIADGDYIVTYAVNRDCYLNDVFTVSRITILSEVETK